MYGLEIFRRAAASLPRKGNANMIAMSWHTTGRVKPYVELTSIAAYFMSMSAPALVAAYTPPPFMAGRVDTRDAVHEVLTTIEPLSPLFAIAGI